MDINLKCVNSADIEFFLRNFDGGSIYLGKDHFDEGIAYLYINHPEKKNAISGKMMVDLRKCVEELEQWSSGKAIILTSTGNNFCSGGDLSLVKEAGNAHGGYLMSHYMHETLLRFRRLPLVSVSLVSGPTLGGGAELSIFSDYVVVADDVKLGFVHAKMGIITAWGGATRLVQMIGERKAMEMLLSSKVYNADECLQMGLAYKVVRTEKRNAETLNFIRQLIVADVSVLRSYKMIVRNAITDSFEGSLKLEMEQFYPKWGNEIQVAAVRSKMKHVEMKIS